MRYLLYDSRHVKITMNLRINISFLLLILDISKSCNEQNCVTKLPNVSFNKSTTEHDSVTLNKTVRSTKSSSILSTLIFKPKRWKIERVTNKQYGIINVLWQKTKVFVEEDYSSLTYKATTTEITPDILKQEVSEKKTSKLLAFLEKSQTSTPSYIEFYYLDPTDDRIRPKPPANVKSKNLNKDNKTIANRSNKIKYPISSAFLIHMNSIGRKRTQHSTKSVQKVGQGHFHRNNLNKSKLTTSVSKTSLAATSKAKNRNNKQLKANRSQQKISIFTKNTYTTTKSKRKEKKVNSGNNSSYYANFINFTYVTKTFLVPASTSKFYDKVKFFEIYDNNTPKGRTYINSNLNNNVIYNNTEEKEKRYRDSEQKILLHQVHENIGHQQDKNKTAYVKKHIQDLYNKERKSENKFNISNYVDRTDFKIPLSITDLEVPFQRNFSWSRAAVWSEYPFVAVYIYEPSQIHCDAAGISPHWLLAAASCLSRHRKGLRGGRLSAFVTFCGDNWRYPQMVSYVKRTIIHPLFHPKDKLRRLFNAGLVQVVNSMANTCSGWAPATLMSHHFVPDEKGLNGTAVGWGLDRYDGNYTTARIPSHPLMIYESRIYSQSCPGSTEYSEGSEEIDIRNVYCLLLPPYVAEENDTVHGALLLIGGKLIALYLKEERRPWGMQSAQYTSIWRLLPWLTEIAREPDESFQLEI